MPFIEEGPSAVSTETGFHVTVWDLRMHRKIVGFYYMFFYYMFLIPKLLGPQFPIKPLLNSVPLAVVRPLVDAMDEYTRASNCNIQNWA